MRRTDRRYWSGGVSRYSVFSVKLETGETYVGEYIGAADGYMYLLVDGDVHRIEQRKIAFLVTGKVDWEALDE